MIKIVLVEDNEVVRNGLIHVLSLQPDMEVVAFASNGLEGFQLFKGDLEADIVLADLNMPVMDGIAMTERLIALQPDLKVIILTMHSKHVFAEKAAKAGAKGYVLKHAAMEELYKAIRAIHAGIPYKFPAELDN